MKKFSLLVGLAVALPACSVKYRTPAPAPVRTPATVNASFDRTWEAVVSYFADRNISIRTIEKASGIIVAEPAIANVHNRRDIPYTNGKINKTLQSPPVYADCGGPDVKPDANGNYSPPFFQYDPNTAVYNLRVLGDQTKSSVQANVRYTTLGNAPANTLNAGTECASTGKWEEEIQAYIKQKAEAK